MTVNEKIPEQINLGERDEGYQKFSYNGKTIELDIFETVQNLNELKKERTEFPNKEGSEANDIKQLLEAKGFTDVSQVIAIKFAKYIIQLVTYIKKNIEQSVLFPQSMDSQPSIETKTEI